MNNQDKAASIRSTTMNTTTSSLNNPADQKPWYVQRWPWLLMLGPFVVVVAATYTGWLAYSRQDALVVDDYYKQGKAINQDLRRDYAATKLGLDLKMRYDPAVGRLSGVLSSTQPVPSDNLILRLVHSTQPEKDINMIAQVDSYGAFNVSLPMLEIARWQVLVESEKRDWRLNGEWNWPKEQVVYIKADPAPAD
jgi:hypothetical protein